MTGIVLALAGLTCGDSGPAAAEAREPVTVGLGGDWEGTWDMGRQVPFRVQMAHGVISRLGHSHVVRLKFRRKQGRDAGTLAAVMEGDTWALLGQGIYRAEPGRLLICIDFLHGAPPPATFSPVPDRTALITLKPAAATRRVGPTATPPARRPQ
jgi:hypothetical protein